MFNDDFFGDENSPNSAIAELIRENSDPETVMHLESGTLSEDDQLQLARDIVFGPLQAWPRFTQAANNHVRNVLMKRGECGENDPISWDVSGMSKLSDEEFMRVRQLQALVPGATVEAVVHSATCGRGVHKRNTAKVAVMIGATGLMREYRLDTDPETERCFEPLAQWPRHTIAAPDHVRRILQNRNECGPYDQVTYTEVDAQLKREEFALATQLKALVPRATLRPIWTIASCGRGQLVRPALRVTFPVYDGMVSRDYRLDVGRR